MPNLWATKSLEKMLSEGTEHGEHSLRRTLGAWSLTALGLGATIGSGIFVLLGITVSRYAGPAVILSFVIAASGCVFAGLCYAEFASMVPVAGSAYTYSYATFGELFAWVIGWDLVLEYSFGAAAVASGWSSYVLSFIGNFGIKMPPAITGTRWDEFVFYQGHWERIGHILPKLRADGIDPAILQHTHGLFNLPAFFVVIFASAVLIVGVRESASLNNAVVLIKICVLVLFVGIGGYYAFHHHALLSSNWQTFIPQNAGEFGHFGWSGVCRGAALIFFAFIGFDAVATAAQEAKHPNRDVSLGILGSLAICTVLYIAVAGVLISLVNYRDLDVADPLALAIETTGLHWTRLLVTVGAIGGLTSTVLVTLLGQSRILYSMSRDGLLPRKFSDIHGRFRTPYESSIIAGLFVALLASFVPIEILTELVSIGTLLAFTSVCLGVWVLRRRRPNLIREFRTPWVPFTPIMGMVIAGTLMFSSTRLAWIRLGTWFAVGLAIYLFYGRYHSRVQEEPRTAAGGGAVGEESVSPERELLTRVLEGFFTVLVVMFLAGVIFTSMSGFFPVLERRFDTIAVVLSLAAIVFGFAYAIAPDVRSLWVLRRRQAEIQQGPGEVDEESMRRELIERLRRASDEHE